MITDRFREEIDNIAGRYVSDITPGFCILLAKDGEPLFRKAYGMADLERSIKIEPEDHFIIASNTKQFVCLAILMLRELGLLDLDETIGRFFPDFPEYRNKVTVRMLMSHTSGITEYFDDAFFNEHEEKLRTATAADVIGMAREVGNKLYFEPDTKISYCNTGYVMLGEIIRKLTGKSFGQFLKEEIFDVLGLTNTCAPEYMDEIDPDQVKGYESEETKGPCASELTKDDFRCVTYDMLEVGYADGNISTNADDILKWHNYLFNEDDDRLLTYEKRKEMWTPHKLKDGTVTPYGMGIMTGAFDDNHKLVSENKRELWHTGGTMGFISRISYFPDDKVSAILLTNWCGIDRDSLFIDIMKEVTEGRFFCYQEEKR